MKFAVSGSRFYNHFILMVVMVGGKPFDLAYSMPHDSELLNPQGRYDIGSALISTGRIIDRSEFDEIRARSDRVVLP